MFQDVLLGVIAVVAIVWLVVAWFLSAEVNGGVDRVGTWLVFSIAGAAGAIVWLCLWVSVVVVLAGSAFVGVFLSGLAAGALSMDEPAVLSEAQMQALVFATVIGVVGVALSWPLARWIQSRLSEAQIKGWRRRLPPKDKDWQPLVLRSTLGAVTAFAGGAFLGFVASGLT